MTKLSWGDSGSRMFETGVDRGVLYTKETLIDGEVVTPTWYGVVWNGLIGVNKTPEGGTSTKYYIDGESYRSETVGQEYASTLEAFTYPEIFNRVQGLKDVGGGLYFDNQLKEEFGLCYRTLIGNELVGERAGYKLNLVYNALATPTQPNSQTVTRMATPGAFTWSLITRPEKYYGYHPTAHVVIDSTRTTEAKLLEVENLLYGTSTSAPTLPTLSELMSIFGGAAKFAINAQEVLGLADLTPGGDDLLYLEGEPNGLYERSVTSDLKTTTTEGLNELE